MFLWGWGKRLAKGITSWERTRSYTKMETKISKLLKIPSTKVYTPRVPSSLQCTLVQMQLINTTQIMTV